MAHATPSTWLGLGLGLGLGVGLGLGLGLGLEEGGRHRQRHEDGAAHEPASVVVVGGGEERAAPGRRQGRHAPDGERPVRDEQAADPKEARQHAPQQAWRALG